MKIRLKVLYLVLLCFTISSCSTDMDSMENDKGYKEYKMDIEKCGVIGVQDIGGSVHIGAISNDKTIMIAFVGSSDSHVILHLDENQVTSERIIFPKSNSNDSNYSENLQFPIFCPYDNNEFIFLTGVSKEIVSHLGNMNTIFVPQWCRYNLQTKVLSKITVKNQEFSDLLNNSFERSIVHWSSASSPGHDIFYLSNYRKLHLQTEVIEDCEFTKPVANPLIQLSSISPDEKKYFSTLNGNELYLNTTRLTELQIIRELNSPWGIHWSQDSKFFSAQATIKEYQPFIKQLAPAIYSINTDNTITLEKSYNMLKKHCSNPNISSGNPVFFSDTSYLYSMNPNLGYYGDLYEFNKKGEVIRRITNFFN